MNFLFNFNKLTLRYKQVAAFLIIVIILFAGIAVNYFVEAKMLRSVAQHTEKNDSIIQHEKYQQLIEKTMFLITQSEHQLSDYVRTSDLMALNEFNKNISLVKNNVTEIKNGYHKYTPKYLVNIFIHKITNRIDYEREIISIFNTSGKEKALEAIDNTENGASLKELSFSVQELINTLNSKIAFLNTEITREKNEMLALDRKWNIASLLFMSVIAFIVLYKMYETNKLNRSLSVSVQKEQQAQLVKDQFIANVTHELRTPLNSIIGYTNLLLKKDHPEEIKEWIQAMKISGSLLMEIINDVLDYSKLESGFIQFANEPFDLNEVMNKLSKVMQVRAESKNLEFVIEMDKDVPFNFKGDEKKLMQVLVNLCGNSIKFTDHGFVKTHISLVKKNNSRSWLQFVISDTGAGIEESKLPYIFERFYQVENSLTKKYVGTGLGLPIVKQLVEMQGGFIDVRSVYGKGTGFTVVIPYAENEKALALLDSDETEMVNHQSCQKNILIVDDNQINRDLIGFILQQGDFYFDNAKNGYEALQMLKEKQYDFILMDVQMPGINGIETTKRIRSELQLQTTIIGLSGFSLPEEEQCSLRAGMNAYLTKPVDEKKLFQLLNHYPDSKNADAENVSLKLINTSYLNKVTGGNKDYIEQIIEKACEALPNEMKQLQQWFDNDNEEKMKETAHSMKTTLHMLGVKDMVADKVKLIEKTNIASTSDKENIMHLLQELDQSVQDVLEELKEYLQAA